MSILRTQRIAKQGAEKSHFLRWEAGLWKVVDELTTQNVNLKTQLATAEVVGAGAQARVK
jgi:hypothetical protein